MLSRKKSKVEKTESPFLNQEKSKDRYMDLASDKRNWRIAFQITAALLAVSIGINANYVLTSKFVPFYVMVDQLGHVISVGPADAANPVDFKRVVRAEMAEWIENTRRVVSDQAAQKAFLRKSYARVDGAGAAKLKLDEFIANTKPFEAAAVNTVEPEVKYTLPRTGNTFEVEWEETRIAPNGQRIGSERWKGVFTYKIVAPTTESAIRANGAGFYITEFQWSKVNG
jgi:type IV secretory pathway TrbF-like protein